jgi:hypothetical protein
MVSVDIICTYIINVMKIGSGVLKLMGVGGSQINIQTNRHTDKMEMA